MRGTSAFSSQYRCFKRIQADTALGLIDRQKLCVKVEQSFQHIDVDADVIVNPYECIELTFEKERGQ